PLPEGEETQDSLLHMQERLAQKRRAVNCRCIAKCRASTRPRAYNAVARVCSRDLCGFHSPWGTASQPSTAKSAWRKPYVVSTCDSRPRARTASVPGTSLGLRW